MQLTSKVFDQSMYILVPTWMLFSLPLSELDIL